MNKFRNLQIIAVILFILFIGGGLLYSHFANAWGNPEFLFGKYAFEFFSMFVAVISAFALNNWNQNRRNSGAEQKILKEISNGLIKDIDDVKLNIGGHETGISACNYWRQIINNKKFDATLLEKNYSALIRDFIAIQNVSGYETLKSKGLEILKNDSLRYDIISLYEYDYNTLRKLEEEYSEMQFHKNYYSDINNILSKHFVFDAIGKIKNIDTPLNLTSEEKNKLLSYLWKIEKDRNFILVYYADLEKRIIKVQNDIKQEIKA